MNASLKADQSLITNIQPASTSPKAFDSLIERIQRTGKLLFTVPEAAELLSLSRATLYREITAKRLLSVQSRRARRIPAEALEHYIKRLMLEQGY